VIWHGSRINKISFQRFRGARLMKKMLLLAAIAAVLYSLADFRQGFIAVQAAHITRIDRALSE